MRPTREEIIKVWTERWVRADLELFAVQMAKREEYERFRYVCAILKDPKKDSAGWTADYRALCASEINSPFHSPFFIVENDRQLVLAKFLIHDLKAWDFHTGAPL
jgi:hypothetical protein